MSEKIKPGMYMIGRQDGTVPPIFVDVQTDGGCMCSESEMDAVSMATHDHHTDKGEWWWRRMAVPQTCPESWENYPPLDPSRGDQ